MAVITWSRLINMKEKEYLINKLTEIKVFKISILKGAILISLLKYDFMTIYYSLFGYKY